MDIMEIVLLIAGGIVFVLSFLIPTQSEESKEEVRGLEKEELKTMVSEELEAVRGHVDDVVEEAVTYSIEKTERSLERLSNEKIMAVNEYSDTVLAEIHKNHEEVMFLYDMLNDKHINLKNTVSEINRTVKEAKETKKEAQEVVNTFQRLTPEVVIPIRDNVDIPQEPVVAREHASMAMPIAAQELAMLQETVAMVSASIGQETSTAQETEEQGQNYNDQILEMYQGGRSPVDIARELDLGVGEVKLVIDLYKNRSGK